MTIFLKTLVVFFFTVIQIIHILFTIEEIKKLENNIFLGNVYELFYTNRTQAVEIAKAEGEKIKKIGLAEAHVIESIGKADAERMRMKAVVYKEYGDAAIMSLVLDALPKVSVLIVHCF